MRNAVTFSPSVSQQPPLSLPTLLEQLSSDQKPLAEVLASRYNLSDWGRACDAQGFRESLYVLDVLDRYLGPPTSAAPGLDIGCKNGCYLPGLHAWTHGPWDGVELDAHRRYWSLTTRRAHGERIARLLPGCRYIAGNVLDLHHSYGFITWFLPFLEPEPLQDWGLPLRFLMPLQLLEHVWSLLLPGGRLLVINQGEEEAELQQQLFQQAGIAAQALGQIESPLSPFQRRRFGWRAERAEA
ncbi:MAG: hypothetical protein HC889_13855 [Synechococcaceae cyanobacterium SM1_2_3]|nr:hypothetical protein [Synechococcaceae cyanobacterium SM1_2_3]